MNADDGSTSGETDAQTTFQHAVDQSLRDFARTQSAELALLGEEAGAFFDAAADFVAVGKRMRPLFCRAGWLIAGGRDHDPNLVGAAAALEWLQASALVHDDVMDGSDTRRGRPSIHREFESRHRTERRGSDAAQFGESVAILMGDLMLSWATQMLTQAALTFDEANARTAIGYFDQCKTEVVTGQLLDVSGQTRRWVTVDEALTIVRFKSAKYTIERPLHIGAALAGAEPALIEQLSNVALPLGAAYQLRDDVLGVFGDPTVTGKPAGDDLREGKRTVLIAHALERLAPEQGSKLLDLLGSDSGVAPATAMLIECGAATAVEADIGDFERDAKAAIRRIGPHAEVILEPLVVAATHRNR